MLLGALGPDEISAVVFVDIALIIVVARLVGALFRRIGQPAVVGEILAGILLGPSLLGLFPGELPERIFPLEVRPFLNVVAQLGLIIFMFIVGLELDTSLVRGKERVAAVISLSSILLPFGLGMLLAAGLHDSHQGAPNAADPLPFGLFIGASMAITAFPVLARILTERGMSRTEIGALALACAAVDDILAWSLLAVVIAVVGSSSLVELPRVLLASIAFVALMFVVVKPRLELLASRYRQTGHLTPGLLAVVLVGLLTSAWITSTIGIHSIFGAFLFGVIMPRDGTIRLFHEILDRLEQVSVLLLLPVFFIVTGLDVDVSGLGRDALTELPLILLVAVAGKFLGATLGAGLQGIPTRKAAAVGVLMNTRGLTELVILNVGKELGVLDAGLFTMLVIMAVVTTIMTGPLLRLAYPDRMLARDVAEAEKAAMGVVVAFRVIVAVDDPSRAGRLVDTACDIVGDESPAEIVLAHYRPLGDRFEVGPGLVSELARTADALEELQALARRAEGRGVPCTVRFRSTERAAEELLAVAVAVEADVVLVPAARTDLIARILSEARSKVVVAADGPAAPDGPDQEILVVAGAGHDDAAAVEVAVRVAGSRGAGIVMAPAEPGHKATRRLAAWAEQISEAGIECRMAPSPSQSTVPAGGGRLAGPGLVVKGSYLGRDPVIEDSRSTLVVRASRDDDGRDLDRLLRRLATAGGEAAASEGREG